MKIRCQNWCWQISETYMFLLRKWPAQLQSVTCCRPLKPHYKATCPYVLYCANSSCSLWYLQLWLWRTREQDSPFLQRNELSGGSAVSVKTDIEFVILAPGGREDLFLDAPAGLLGWMFICLSQWQKLLSVTKVSFLKNHQQSLIITQLNITCRWWSVTDVDETNMNCDHIKTTSKHLWEVITTSHSGSHGTAGAMVWPTILLKVNFITVPVKITLNIHHLAP